MSNSGINLSSGNMVVSPANRQLLADTSSPTGIKIDKIDPNILTLNKFESKCLLIQLGSLESNTNSNLVSLGQPTIGIYKANISSNTSFANVATVTITNSDHTDIKLGMMANVVGSSTGAFGINPLVVAKSIGGNIIAGNFIPGCTYTVTSLGTTDFTLIGGASTVGNVFIANAAGSGTGTALGTNNQIILSNNHTVSGDITFTVNPLKLGKYQVSEWVLITQEYKSNSGAWTSKNGIDSNEVFLSAPYIQDDIMYKFIQEKYVELVKSGAIRTTDNKEVIAGMLALAYQYQDVGYPLLKQNIYNTNGTINLENFSVGTKANLWRTTGQTLDSQGRPGHIYFNGGRYAIGTLGADVPE